MRTTRYSKYESTLDDIDSADLMQMLQDAFMGADRNSPWDPDPDGRMTAEELYDAILQALMERDLVPEDLMREARFADRKEDTRLYKEIQKPQLSQSDFSSGTIPNGRRNSRIASSGTPRLIAV